MTVVDKRSDRDAPGGDLEGLSITASGVDRNGPTLVPVDRYISAEWMAARKREGVASGLAGRLLGRPRGRPG